MHQLGLSADHIAPAERAAHIAFPLYPGPGSSASNDAEAGSGAESASLLQAQLHTAQPASVLLSDEDFAQHLASLSIGAGAQGSAQVNY